MARFLPHAKISSIHGQAFQINGRLVVPMYHPAAALHQGSLRPQLEQDFAQLPSLIKKSASVPPPPEELSSPEPETPRLEPKQLSLF